MFVIRCAVLASLCLLCLADLDTTPYPEAEIGTTPALYETTDDTITSLKKSANHTWVAIKSVLYSKVGVPFQKHVVRRIAKGIYAIGRFFNIAGKKSIHAINTAIPNAGDPAIICEKMGCSFCSDVSVPSFDFSKHVCVEMVLQPAELGVLVRLIFDGKTFTEYHVSWKKSATVRMDLGGLYSVFFRTKMYNTYFHNNTLYTCVSLEMDFSNNNMLYMELGCYYLGASGAGKWTEGGKGRVGTKEADGDAEEGSVNRTSIAPTEGTEISPTIDVQGTATKQRIIHEMRDNVKGDSAEDTERPRSPTTESHDETLKQPTEHDMKDHRNIGDGLTTEYQTERKIEKTLREEKEISEAMGDGLTTEYQTERKIEKTLKEEKEITESMEASLGPPTTDTTQELPTEVSPANLVDLLYGDKSGLNKKVLNLISWRNDRGVLEPRVVSPEEIAREFLLEKESSPGERFPRGVNSVEEDNKGNLDNCVGYRGCGNKNCRGRCNGKKKMLKSVERNHDLDTEREEAFSKFIWNFMGKKDSQEKNKTSTSSNEGKKEKFVTRGFGDDNTDDVEEFNLKNGNVNEYQLKSLSLKEEDDDEYLSEVEAQKFLLVDLVAKISQAISENEWDEFLTKYHQ